MDETIISEIRKTKRQLEAGSPQLKAAFERITERIRREADTIQSSLAGGRSPLPEVDFKAVAAGTVSDAAKNEMRKRGFAIVRGVYPGSQAEAWNDELGRYIEDNEYFAKAEQKRGLDKYFSKLRGQAADLRHLLVEAADGGAPASEPWLRPRFLNRLWRVDGRKGRDFDPDRECTYADRIRRREPGDTSLGLSPHMDAGSVERWLDPDYPARVPRRSSPATGAPMIRSTARSGRDRGDPLAGRLRAFRTFQGWTALTPQGRATAPCSWCRSPGHRLSAAASAAGGRAGGRCCAAPSRGARSIERNGTRAEAGGLADPAGRAGRHRVVAPRHRPCRRGSARGSGYSNVIYIGAAPYCAKNAAYLARQEGQGLPRPARARPISRRRTTRLTSTAAPPPTT